MTTTRHKCNVPSCPVTIPVAYLFCEFHEERLSQKPKLRRAIRDAEFTEDYERAVAAAAAAIGP